MTNQVPPNSTSPKNSPRRIAFCITDLDAGGAEKALVQLVLGLDRTLWEPRVYCLGPEAELAAQLRQQGVVVQCCGARSWRSFGVFRWLTLKLREFQPVLLQCFLFHGNFVGRISGRRAKIPVIVAGHRVAEREKHWHLWLDAWTRTWVDHHVCVSQGVAELVKRKLHLSADQLTVIPNGVTVPPRNPSPPEKSISEKFGFPIRAPVILAVGRLHPQKNFLALLQAFKILVEQLPECRLLIVGEGPQRAELEQAVRDLQLNDVVCLVGKRLDVLELMQQSALLAMTSRWEGMPNVVLEAMASGLPVVTMDVEGLGELMPDERCGLVVKQGDIRGFVVAMQRILQDKQLKTVISESAQRIIEKDFTWPVMVQRYAALYSRLID